ncbi:OLC1v1031296C3 [Oldenlandia corymbosa var. corymbosa]|uniref:OLC1v1031296C3 n=1 Tax=Oldenlandia corymbosa var. corymbosa TaxID=529605 RepID=A0AAV1CIW6_OLDCO|nr:OLC1v1031296C3 [Oldenlandia corymbosa var. corymbosa]
MVNYQEEEEEEKYSALLQTQLLSTPNNRLNSFMRRFGGKKKNKKMVWGKKIISSHIDVDDDDDNDVDHEEEEEDGSFGNLLFGGKQHLELDDDDLMAKASLLERIASLEDRLLQMCMEIESYRRSCSSSSLNTSSGASSSSNNGSRFERMSSYPTFVYKPQSIPQPQAPYNLSAFETETPQPQAKITKTSSSVKEQANIKTKKDGEKGRKLKNGNSPNWPRLKILGC